MPLNKPLLRRIKKHITEEPKRLAMGWWLQHKSELRVVATDQVSVHMREYSFPECGTVGCIAGWAVMLAKPPVSTEISALTVKARAEKLLGIDPIKAMRLFSLPSWPYKFANAYHKAKSHKTKAKVTCNRIDHFMKYEE